MAVETNRHPDTLGTTLNAVHIVVPAGSEAAADALMVRAWRASDSAGSPQEDPDIYGTFATAPGASPSGAEPAQKKICSIWASDAFASRLELAFRANNNPPLPGSAVIVQRFLEGDTNDMDWLLNRLGQQKIVPEEP